MHPETRRYSQIPYASVYIAVFPSPRTRKGEKTNYPPKCRAIYIFSRNESKLLYADQMRLQFNLLTETGERAHIMHIIL